jgi:hypothetical protein
MMVPALIGGTVMDDTERHYSDEQVTGGSKEGVVRYVLGFSLLLIVLAMSAVWIIPSLID